MRGREKDEVCISTPRKCCCKLNALGHLGSLLLIHSQGCHIRIDVSFDALKSLLAH
jgi:hypothetical protein